MNDWLDYKGSGSNRYYLSHGIYTQQVIADARLQQAQEIKKSLTITYQNMSHFCQDFEISRIKYGPQQMISGKVSILMKLIITNFVAYIIDAILYIKV